MKIIRLMDVIDVVAPASLTSSNITNPESGTVTYSGATTYALGDKVSNDSASTTVTITMASPGVITWTAHELVSGDKISFTTTGVLPPNIKASTLYFVKDILTVDTFTLSQSDGGQAINTQSISGSQSGTHTCLVYQYSVYQSLQATNLNHHPRKLSSSAWWQKLGATNKYKMFDGSITSQTIGTGSIDVSIAVSRAVNTIYLANISAGQVQVICTDTTLGVVHNVSYMTSETINGVIEYFLELVISNITSFSSGTIRVILSKSASYPVTATAIGAMLIGYAIDAGGTQYDASTGIQDFSVIDQNEFGDYDIVPRTFRKTGSFQIMVANADIARVCRILTQQRTLKTLYIGSDDYTSTAIYGFPSDWSVIIRYPSHSILNVDLQGLT